MATPAKYAYNPLHFLAEQANPPGHYYGGNAQ
jgi:hypothetical protein